MNSFIKVFAASLLALFVFVVVGFFILMALVSSVASASKPETGNKAVLLIDLDDAYHEQVRSNPLAAFSGDDQYDQPGLFDLVRMIKHAKSDSSIKGIYIKCHQNSNGIASSEEIRNALLDFKSGNKFIYAYGDVISQGAYYVANVADKIYCNPKGGLEWKGYSIDYLFLKQALNKLEIEPQIFYAGKFKSATEPFREDKMSEPNRIQTRELLDYIYKNLLVNTSKARGLDTATLHSYADQLLIRTASDAVRYKLIDGIKYDDEVQAEIKKLIKIDSDKKINFVSTGKYAKAVNFKRGKGSDRIAVIYAEGDIVDGKGGQQQIGGDRFRDLVRKARFDDRIKAIVFRVNSGGGSALASEVMWREISITRKVKPVILSFGDVAASGGYYLAADADSIFAQPNTITGSIGVFTIIPNMQDFFRNKLGVTFDGVKTAEHADAMSAVKPLSETEKRFVQAHVDSIYVTFLTRVAEGRGMNIAQVDSIAQGRVWTGEKALALGLVDRIGNIQDAIDCAARMAKLDHYGVREYPEPQTLLQSLFGGYNESATNKSIRETLGEDDFRIFITLKKMKALVGTTQMRMPFEISIR
jgi:protease IV